MLERYWLGDLGKNRSPALLRGFHRNRFQPVQPDAVDNGPLRYHRDQPRRSQLGRFLDEPVGLRTLHRREGQPDVGDRFRIAGFPLYPERHSLAACFGHIRQPFARLSVEQQKPIAFLQPHDIAEIIGLRPIEFDVGAFGQPLPDEQAGQAFGRPGGRRGHCRRLAGAAP